MEYLANMTWPVAEAHAKSTGEKIRRWDNVEFWLVYVLGVWLKEFFAGPNAGVIREVRNDEWGFAEWTATDYTTMRPDQYACPTEPLPPPVPEPGPGGPVRRRIEGRHVIGLPPWPPGQVRVVPLPGGGVEARSGYTGEQILAARADFAPDARILPSELKNPLAVPTRMVVQSRFYPETPLIAQRAPLHIGDVVFEDVVINFERHMEAGQAIPVWLTAPAPRLIEPGTQGNIAYMTVGYALCLTFFVQ